MPSCSSTRQVQALFGTCRISGRQYLQDEIDAALDNINIVKVTDFIRSMEDSLQTILISHKEEFYSCADMLIGTYSESSPEDRIMSGFVTLILSKHD
ncbi:unnamed protein product [Leptidea sinapis]|uniref:Uncharacterized protein n=1 Tax=Leptidea sinapis TaxID=189913 RepID=A0A5E4R732_9NEOP|nr:unnamed protein product [Leptidea sinapis]